MLGTSELIAGLIGALAAGSAVAAYAAWRGRRAAGRAEALVDSAPVGLWHRPTADGPWRLNATGRALLGLDADAAPTPEAVLACLAPAHRDALAAAVEDLSESGRGFSRSADGAEAGRVLELTGRVVAGRSIVWIADTSDAAALAEDYAQKDLRLSMLEAVLDSVPTPVWWRDQETLGLIGCNAAYGRAVDAVPGEALARGLELHGASGRELARRAAHTGVAQSESHYVVIDGERRLLDLNEAPAEGVAGILAGTARDMTELEALQDRLADHIAAHDEVLERLGAAIAIYSADRRMTFHNSAFVALWGLAADALAEGPTLSGVLQMLRERRALPEMIDFPAYRREQDRLFTSLLEPKAELLHLPDERTVRMTVSPHPQGGLIFVYEDVTDYLQLERSHSTLAAVQRLTLDSLYEAVCVFGADGRIKLFNDGFARLFSYDAGWLEDGPHIADMVDRARAVLPPADDWDDYKRRAVLSVSEPNHRTGRMELQTGRIVDFAYVPLPDGQCLLLYLDVTDSVRVERALKERNAALENADLLKSQFISSISYELRSPLNAILGFTELLREETYGPLNDRQRDQVGHIHTASRDLAALIGDVLDLAALQAGYLAIERGPVDLDALIARVVEAARADAHAHGIRLEVEAGDGLGRLEGDGERLAQAIQRVVANAIAFSPDNGHVTLSATRRDDEVSIIVTESGHVFADNERFRLPAGTGDGIGDGGRAGASDGDAVLGQMTGAGVGLALCKSLVELHDGVFSVERLGGDRAAVRCRLPVTAAE